MKHERPQHVRKHRLAQHALAAVWGLAWLLSTALAQPPAAEPPDDEATETVDETTTTNAGVPLYEQPPRDWLKLRDDPSADSSDARPNETSSAPADDAAAEAASGKKEPAIVELYVLPITLTGSDASEPGKARRLPAEPDPGRSFEVRLADRPQDVYKVYWRDVIEIKLFEQRLLDEAERLAAAGRYDDAYGYYEFLDANYPDFGGVQDSLQRYLMREAGTLFADGQIERATLLLVELHDRNPDFPRLSRALGVAIDALVVQSDAAEDYKRCRQYVETLASLYPDHPVAAQWRARWNERARQSIAQAQSLANAGNFRQAHALVRGALQVWPQVSGAAEFFDRLATQYDYVAVGVTEQSAAHAAERTIVSWTARRRARLVGRDLVELSGYGPDGATYHSPFAEFESTDLGLGLRFNIRNDIPWQPGDVILSASDVSRHLLAMADARSSAFVPLWADLFENVRTTSAKSLTVQLTRGYVRPQAVLRVPVLPWNLMLPDGDDAPSLGGYRPLEPADDGTHFVARPGYFAAEDGQPDEINERIFSSTTAAVAALRDGEIAAVDRVAPWEIENLRKHDELLVTPYVVPTIHCLIPGRASELAQSRVFRRAILYGIDRQEILDNWLLRGASIPGCRVITGPFPTGYAYDDEVEPRGFKPQLGMTLLWSAWRASVAANEKTDGGGEGDAESNTTETESVSFPELTLAHPNNEIATRASQQIRNYLRALGVPIRLVPFDPATQWDLDAYDLIYAELFVSEPLVDVSTLFGPGGLIEGNGAFLDQYVRSVELATDSRAARNDLLAIHRRVYEDLPIIPLWQLTEHFAVDRRLEGVGAPAVSLYDTVEQWRVPPWQMEGTP